MGLEYCFSLIFPREEVWNVLENVGEFSAYQGEKEVELVLPNRRLILPLALSSGAESIIISDLEQNLQFDTSLYFKPDQAIEEYETEEENYSRGMKGFEPCGKNARDAQGRVSIGCIYLSVHTFIPSMPKVSIFDFAAATSDMSNLFLKSQSIQNAFLELLKTHNGIAGELYDSDEYEELIRIYPLDFDTEQFRQDYWA